MSLKRSSRSGEILATVVIGLAVLSAWMLSNRAEVLRKRAQTPTVAAWESPISAPVDVEPDEDRPTPQPTPVVGVARARGPLTFAGPDGVIVLDPKARYDLVDAECARKLLVVIAREGWPDEATPYEFATFRDARHGAAWRACPPEFRR